RIRLNTDNPRPTIHERLGRLANVRPDIEAKIARLDQTAIKNSRERPLSAYRRIDTPIDVACRRIETRPIQCRLELPMVHGSVPCEDDGRDKCLASVWDCNGPMWADANSVSSYGLQWDHAPKGAEAGRHLRPRTMMPHTPSSRRPPCASPPPP